MTPLNPQAQHPGSFIGFTSGLLIGLILLCLGGAGGVVWVRKAHTDARKGWILLPVVVAAQDIPEGTTVTMEMISQRSIPEQFVTSSVVKPESASYVVNQVALAPMQAGDPLLWSTFEKKKSSRVLFVNRDTRVGEKLSADDLETRLVADGLLSSSWVLEKEKERVSQRAVTTEFRKGDPVLWTHLEGGDK